MGLEGLLESGVGKSGRDRPSVRPGEKRVGRRISVAGGTGSRVPDRRSRFAIGIALRLEQVAHRASIVRFAEPSRRGSPSRSRSARFWPLLRPVSRALSRFCLGCRRGGSSGPSSTSSTSSKLRWELMDFEALAMSRRASILQVASIDRISGRLRRRRQRSMGARRNLPGRSLDCQPSAPIEPGSGRARPWELMEAGAMKCRSRPAALPSRR